MKTTCSKCGSLIKNIVTINGKIYGTSCAEVVLGVKLPKNFNGDGSAFKMKKEISLKQFSSDFEKTIEATKKGWNVNVYFTNAYRKATNDWERSFVRSCSDRVGSTILTFLKGDLGFENSKENWGIEMGSFPYRDYDLNEKLCLLSDKQMSILDKIITKQLK